IPGYDGCIGIPAFGPSMLPTIEDGTTVLGRRIWNKQSIMWGECYIILTSDYLTVKRIRKNSKPNYVELWSDYYDPEHSEKSAYSPVEMHLDELLGLWIVKGKFKDTNN